MADFLPNKVVYYLKNVFNELDFENTGEVVIDDVVDVGFKYRTRSHEYNAGLVAGELDSSGKGRMKFSTFTRFFGRYLIETSFHAICTDVFVLLDIEGRGYLTYSELLRYLQDYDPGVTKNDVKSLVHFVDKGNEGKITPQVFEDIASLCGLDFPSHVESKKKDVETDAMLLMRAEQQYNLKKKENSLLEGKEECEENKKDYSLIPGKKNDVPFRTLFQNENSSLTVNRSRSSTQSSSNIRPHTSFGTRPSRTSFSSTRQSAHYRPYANRPYSAATDTFISTFSTPFFSNTTHENVTSSIFDDMVLGRGRKKHGTDFEFGEEAGGKKEKYKPSPLGIPGNSEDCSMFCRCPISPSTRQSSSFPSNSSTSSLTPYSMSRRATISHLPPQSLNESSSVSFSTKFPE
ncbi:uncharacterized protein MONOS_3376 [Monocercomonoides exilis]|uniref:uncharacterized protein n=1 Tax=Monocercomonoides exilis TaxID=2049356 RepID=UPI0035597A92|nr:hypothetical protein MONOS_3376 [Monocercomonoides exilis]|eukprot:MONOS_3376.1-p1 / transcript=MONOS_3376.1 / gene=MONOS_3376 / organism=Monocercomonoides_exilis_PA203 / gene_product=unspecified product / transcript_product=unspecified product / location=Mono_scaffold00079:41884-43155(-) / protein_length=404 / sequence_SO=supercontig / SO=protein_coding / is_pseudo=false